MWNWILTLYTWQTLYNIFIQTSSEKEKDLSVFPKSNVYGLYVFKCCQFLSCKTTWAKPKVCLLNCWFLLIYNCQTFVNTSLLWVLACFSGACAVDASLLWLQPISVGNSVQTWDYFSNRDLNITVGLTPWQKFTAYAQRFFVWTVLSVACLKFLLNLASNKLKKRIQYSCVKNNATVFYKYMYIGMYILYFSKSMPMWMGCTNCKSVPL